MEAFYRHNKITPTDEMADTDRDYLREIVVNKGVNLLDLSESIGYNKLYISTCIYDGRMPIELLKYLSEILSFDCDKAIARKKKKRK